jgi:hypothetical protein
MGAKNKKNAQDSGSGIQKNQSNKPVPKKDEGAVESCPYRKHWFGAKVVDEAGNIVTDVAAKIKLIDGSEVEVDFAADTDDDGVWKTEKVLPAGDCVVAFPEVYNMEWWPQGGSGGDFTVAQSYDVADGDCAVSIAAQLGFRDYLSIWTRTKNKGLKAKRPNANQLLIGDTLMAPDQKDKTVSKATDKVWTFVVKTRKPTKLRLTLVDKDNKPLSGKDWELLSPTSDSGTTGGDGLIEFNDIPLDQNSAKLKVKLADPPPPLDPLDPVDTTAPMPYPINIIPTDFKDAGEAKTPQGTVEWTLQVGSLPTFDDATGVQARLHNLGFGCNTGDDDDRTAKAVKAYQKFFQSKKNPSGATKDIASDIRDRHDKAR